MNIFGLMITVVACLQGVTKAYAAEDGWKYSVTPYVWLPSFNATLKYKFPDIGGSADVETYYLNKLNAALMLTGDARKGPVSFYTDYIYLNIAGSDSHVKALDFGGSIVGTTIDAGTQTTIKGDVLTIGGGYTAMQSDIAILDVIGGVRYLGIDISTDWHLSAAINGPGPSQTFPKDGNVAARTDLWNAIIGLRGRMGLGDEGKWSMHYYLDVGTGSSTDSLQALIGLSYAYDWGDVLLAYRHLSYKQGSDKFIQNLSLSGPMLGAKFHF